MLLASKLAPCVSKQTMLGIILGLTVFMLACGADIEPADQPTSTPPTPVVTAVPTLLPTQIAQATPASKQAPPPDERLFGNPVYELVATWGEATNSGISFASPNGIAIDSSDNVYVTEFRGNRVQKFTSDGDLTRISQIDQIDDWRSLEKLQYTAYYTGINGI